MQLKECFREVLQKWLKQDVRPTWSTLELAITNAQKEELGLEPLLESMANHIQFSILCICHIYWEIFGEFVIGRFW